MVFCGIEEASFNDFPGKISCVLFVSGCNFFCPYCHNPQTVTNNSKNILNIEKIFSFLKKRKHFYDGIVISGGEPTLNYELPSICKRIKDMGYDLKLDTNGSRPEMLERLLEDNLLDYIAMDIKDYPLEHFYKYFTKEADIINKIKKSINLIINKIAYHEFRTTCVHPFITSDKVKRISRLISGAQAYNFQPFNKRASSILNKVFFKDIIPKISKKEMLEFVNIASPMVKDCKIKD